MVLLFDNLLCNNKSDKSHQDRVSLPSYGANRRISKQMAFVRQYYTHNQPLFIAECLLRLKWIAYSRYYVFEITRRRFERSINRRVLLGRFSLLDVMTEIDTIYS